MTWQLNPIVAELEKIGEDLKNALVEALDSGAGKSAIDAIEALCINAAVKAVLGAIPGGALVSGVAAEKLVEFATHATNDALDKLAPKPPSAAPPSASSGSVADAVKQMAGG